MRQEKKSCSKKSVCEVVPQSETLGPHPYERGAVTSEEGEDEVISEWAYQW